jgi:drug/metabolite transporter (DMT)-like permease
MKTSIVLVLVLGSVLAASGTVLLKVGASNREEFLSFLNIHIFFGLALYALGAVLWIYGMSKQSLISVYPFTVLSFVIVYFVGIFWLQEMPSRSGLAGVGFILAGLYLIARNAT